MDVYFRRLLPSVVGAPQPNKLAKAMARNLSWPECSGSKICSGDLNFANNGSNCAVCSGKKFHANRGRCERLMEVFQRTTKFLKKDVRCTKLFLVRVTVTTSNNKPTQALTDFHVRTCQPCVVLQHPLICVRSCRAILHVVWEIDCCIILLHAVCTHPNNFGRRLRFKSLR